MLIKEGYGLATIPQSIVRRSKRLLLGKNPLVMLARVKTILELFDDELYDVTEELVLLIQVVAK